MDPLQWLATYLPILPQFSFTWPIPASPTPSPHICLHFKMQDKPIRNPRNGIQFLILPITIPCYQITLNRMPKCQWKCQGVNKPIIWKFNINIFHRVRLMFILSRDTGRSGINVPDLVWKIKQIGQPLLIKSKNLIVQSQ